jgi:phosphoribosylamine--glycine ligase
MKVLIVDMEDGAGVDLAVRATGAGHGVRYFTKNEWNGKGLIERVDEWEPSMDWAELIVLTGNALYAAALEPYFEEGYPIFGANRRAAELELDRAVGQRALEKAGVPVLPYETFESLDQAIAYVAKTKKPYAIKPWGGEGDKSMTFVARDADEALYMLKRWKSEEKVGSLMLQEKVDGIEMGIAGWFGPHGWSTLKEESFEHKKFMNDDLGCNTGEMGTVIRHVRKSQLFDEILKPLTDQLRGLGYVGDCNVNCMVNGDGAWPFEFTMRLGWPDFNIRQAVLRGDPIGWMAALVNGYDSFHTSDEVVVGVVLVHGDFPTEKEPRHKSVGFPINGIKAVDMNDFHPQQIMAGDGQMVSAGCYLAVVTGSGDTVHEAAAAAYDVAWQVEMPSNLMFRTDIGERLKTDLPKLHKLGYAIGMDY